MFIPMEAGRPMLILLIVNVIAIAVLLILVCNIPNANFKGDPDYYANNSLFLTWSHSVIARQDRVPHFLQM